MNRHMKLHNICLETVFEYGKWYHAAVRESLILFWINRVELTYFRSKTINKIFSVASDQTLQR